MRPVTALVQSISMLTYCSLRKSSLTHGGEKNLNFNFMFYPYSNLRWGKIRSRTWCFHFSVPTKKEHSREREREREGERKCLLGKNCCSELKHWVYI